MNWREDTQNHINRVGTLLRGFQTLLGARSWAHDKTKLESPEAEVFAEFTAKLKGCTYGSDEYKGFLADMKPALDHHYECNRHHPEHFKLWKCPICAGVFKEEETRESDCYTSRPRFCPACCPVGTIMECILEPHVGVEGMNLIDILEMIADWQAASERHGDGDIRRSIEINAKRFNLSDQLTAILLNTVELLEDIDKGILRE